MVNVADDTPTKTQSVRQRHGGSIAPKMILDLDQQATQLIIRIEQRLLRFTEEGFARDAFRPMLRPVMSCQSDQKSAAFRSRIGMRQARRSADRWDADAVYKPFAIFDGKRWLLWYNGRRGGVEQIGAAIHDSENLGFGTSGD